MSKKRIIKYLQFFYLSSGVEGGCPSLHWSIINHTDKPKLFPSFAQIFSEESKNWTHTNAAAAADAACEKKTFFYFQMHVDRSVSQFLRFRRIL